MQSLGERLTHARKKCGLTQEQLAEAMHCSRQTISHWETGRSQPDVEALAQLNTLLNCDLLNTQDASPAPMPEIVQPAEPVPVVSLTSPRTFNWQYLTCFALGALLMLSLMLLLWPKAPAKEQQTAAVQAYDMAWYATLAEPVAGQAYLNLYCATDPIPLIRKDDFPDGVGWLFDIHIDETGGHAITIDEIFYSFIRYERSQLVPQFTLSGDKLFEHFHGEPYIPSHGGTALGIGLPQQELLGIGICVRGTDEHGNRLEFRNYFPFSQEIQD